MYAETDLDAAVQAGVISQDAVDALRAHVARMRNAPIADEEQFRLLTGFNDIFVSIAILILLVALGWLGAALPIAKKFDIPVGSGVLIATASWSLAEYFTRKRRMALPSILLLSGFVSGVAWTCLGILVWIFGDANGRTGGILAASAMAVTTLAAWLHWRRFMVPITIAALTAAAFATAVALCVAAIPSLADHLIALMLPCGLGVFALAMWWDISDRARTTRRADVAFWLHLLAAPLIAHSLFYLVGVFDGEVGTGKALTVLALYTVFTIVALAVDRRALLVSSLLYVLYALYALFEKAGAVELSAAYTAFVIGSALLLLSALWQGVRTKILTLLPDAVREKLPMVA